MDIDRHGVVPVSTTDAGTRTGGGAAVSESVQGRFDTPLDDKLAQVAKDRVNARPSVVAERFATLRWKLDRADRNHCDGFATDATPGVEAGEPVEVKACRVRHKSPDGGTREGRVSVHVDSHDRLEDEDGHYAIVVYSIVEVDGGKRVVVLADGLVEASDIGSLLPSSCRAEYQKVRWSRVLNVDVDETRWSR